jgi:polysaccharide biosynthesis protein PslF
MRILFITGEFPPMQGGVGDYTHELGQALQDLGCEVQVLTSSQAGSARRLTVRPVIDRWDWSCWRRILTVVEDYRPDVLHIQYQAAAFAMHPAINLLPRRLRLGATGHQRAAGRPCSAVTFHDLKVPYLFPKAGPLRRWVIGELARQSDLAITTNRQDFEELQQHLGSPPALLPIGSNIIPRLPPGYDREAWRARWGAGPGDLLLCFFGFVNDRKGVDTLVHALKMLVSDPTCPVKPLLLMMGGQTGASDPTNVAWLARIEALIVELGLEERIRWTGYLPGEEISASFHAADLCVLPFRDGVSFLHGTFHAALAHGTPILTTQPGIHLPELVHEGNVFLVPPNQPAALAQAIVRLEADLDLRHSLGAGAAILSQRFRWDVIARNLQDLYASHCRQA